MKTIVRWQHASVYRYAKADCTNGGLSSKYDFVDVLDGDVDDCVKYAEEHNIDIKRCLHVVRRELWGRPEPYLEPLEWAVNEPNGLTMFGGNYAKGDSRWRDWFGHSLPLPIHDRCESQEMYNELTR